MAIQEKINQITAINQKLATLEQQINTAKAETRKLIDKRDRLNDEYREMRQEAHDLKTERDSLNERAQNLKMLRDETRSKTQAIVEELREATKKIRELKGKTPKRSNSDLQEELDGIEWKIQTTSLGLGEEKELIESVKKLETQLSAYRRIEKQSKKMTDLRKSIEALDIQADTFHDELQSTAKKSQEIHAKMLSRISESKKIKAEADSLHSAYIQAREKTEPSTREYRRLLEQKKALEELLRTEEEARHRGKQQELKDKIVKEAREKMRKGEELSWNEFQLLNEDDSQPQN